MFEITVHLPSSLTAPEPAREFELEATTVRDAVEQVVARAPGLAPRILHEGRPLVGFVLNGRQLRPSEALGYRARARRPARVLPAGRRRLRSCDRDAREGASRGVNRPHTVR